MKSYQDWCVDQLVSSLSQAGQYVGVLDDYGYRVILKYIIRHYPEISYVNGEEVHFWTKSIAAAKLPQVYRRYVYSREAFAVVSESLRTNDVEHIHKELYQEHITPIAWIYDELLALQAAGKVTRKAVLNCMCPDKLVILTQEQGRALDHAKFDAKDISSVEGVLDKSEKDEVGRLIGRGCKSNGTGVLRMGKLLNLGVELVDPDGESLDIAACARYLKTGFPW